MTSTGFPRAMLKRAVMNITAIAAVCVIFGAKAMEIEHRTSEAAVPVALSAAPLQESGAQ